MIGKNEITNRSWRQYGIGNGLYHYSIFLNAGSNFRTCRRPGRLGTDSIPTCIRQDRNAGRASRRVSARPIRAGTAAVPYPSDFKAVRPERGTTVPPSDRRSSFIAGESWSSHGRLPPAHAIDATDRLDLGRVAGISKTISIEQPQEIDIRHDIARRPGRLIAGMQQAVRQLTIDSNGFDHRRQRNQFSRRLACAGWQARR